MYYERTRARNYYRQPDTHWRLSGWHMLGGAVGFVFFIVVLSMLWTHLWR